MGESLQEPLIEFRGPLKKKKRFLAQVDPFTE